MATKTLYPNTVTQTSGAPYRKFANLNNVKNSSSTYARSENVSYGIGSKVGTYPRPSKITATNFKCNIPNGAKINSVTVEYASRKEGYLAIGKTTVSLVGVSGVGTKNGSAQTSTMTKSSLKFSSNNLTVGKVNSSSFGVSIDFPKNSTYNTGYVRVQYIRIIVDYTLPNYSLTASKVIGDYEGDEYIINTGISNVAKTPNDSTVTITLPSGVSFVSKDGGEGSVSSDGQVLTWKPGLSSSVLSRNVTLRLLVNSTGSYNIGFREAGSGHTKTLTLTADIRPEPEPVEPEEEEIVYIEPEIEAQALTIKQNNPFMVNKTLTTEEASQMNEYDTGKKVGTFIIFSNPGFENNFRSFNTSTGKYEYDETYWVDESSAYFDSDGNLESVSTASGKLNIATVGKFSLVLVGGTVTSSEGTTTVDIELAKFDIEVYPETLTTPTLTILKPTVEETNRLGNGYVYTVQTYLQEVTTDDYVKDWGRNFRIGVFNNSIPGTISNIQVVNSDGENEEITVDTTNYDNLTIEEIFSNAEYWSNPPSEVNAYEDLQVTFPYQEQYPLYIIITGDYREANPKESIKFTEPCIIENYNGWETNGTHPIPLRDSIKSENLSELTIPPFASSNKFIVYDSPVEDIITDKYFIKGISVDLDVDYTDYLSLNVMLDTGKGKGERSLILEPGDVGTITLGDQNDRWNLTPNQLVNPEDWEIILQVNNVFNSDNSDSEVHFNNITVNYYVSELTEQVISCMIDGENLAIYDTLIQDVEVPAGLETETKLIDIEGTDLNDAYLQNIREKTIKIKLSIMGCSLEETTRTLQELTALLTNERDSLNRPIPKRLELSHYPGIHWDYVMKDPIDTDITVSDYETTIKLLIPSGTAYANEEVITNTVGKINGIAKVNPIIQFIPQSTHIEILEKNSQQKFTMSYNTWNNSDTVLIDCENRKVTLTNSDGEKTDITAYTDYGADWFLLLGEFEFQPVNCIIQTVSRVERM